MKNQTVIIILVVAAALLAFVFLFERDTLTTGERKERKDRVFAEFRKDQVDHLAIRGTDGQKVVVERVKEIEGQGGEAWRVKSPLSVDADPSEVRSVLSAIDFLLKARTVKGPEKKAETKYGLDSPRVEASFTVKGQTTTFKIGADAPEDKVYIAVDAVKDDLFAVDKAFLESMDKKIGDLRSKNIVTQSLGEAVSVVLVNEQDTIKLERKKDGPWQVLVDGTWILASFQQVSELLRTLSDLRAAQFVADGAKKEDLSMYGLAEPSGKVTIRLDKDNHVTVLIGNPCAEEKGQLYITVEGQGTVTCVKDDFSPALASPKKQFEEASPAVFRSDEVEEITLERKDRRLTLKKQDNQWRFADEESPSVAQIAVDELLTALGETRATQIQVGEKVIQTLPLPIGSVTLGRQGELGDVSLALFAGLDSGTMRMTRGKEQAVLTVPGTIGDKVRPDVLAFRNRQISNGDAHDVVKLKIEGVASQELKEDNGEWKLVQPVQVEADRQRAQKLAGLLSEINVKRYAAAKADSQHGFKAPFGVVTATFIEEKQTDKGKDRTGSKTVVLELGATAADEGRFARLKGNDQTVFVVGSDYDDAINSPLAARDLLQIDDAEMAFLTLKVNGKELSMKQNGDKWSKEDGSEVDTDTLKRLIIDLSSIKAIRTASFGPKGSDFANPTLVLESRSKDQAPTVITFGSRSDDPKEEGYLARIKGIDITFVLPARIVTDLVDFARKTVILVPIPK